VVDVNGLREVFFAVGLLGGGARQWFSQSNIDGTADPFTALRLTLDLKWFQVSENELDGELV
jgi:hypothetical protein